MKMHGNNKYNLIARAELLAEQNNNDLFVDFKSSRAQTLHERLTEKQKNWKNVHQEQIYKRLADLQGSVHCFNKNAISSHFPLRRRLLDLTKQDFDHVTNYIKMCRKHLGLECVILNANENKMFGQINFTKFGPKKTVTIAISRHSKHIIFYTSDDKEILK